MKDREKDWKALNEAESELPFVTPKEAEKLSRKIIRLKWKIFKNE